VKVPTPSKPHGQDRKKLKKMKMLDLAYVLPTPRLIEEGRPYHFPSYIMSSNKQAKKEKKCTIKLENERRGLGIATKSPKGVLKCCVCFFGVAKSLQPDLIYLQK
jgi:hypothetical protein